MSLPQFMADVRDEGPLAECVNGDVVTHLPPSARHRDAALFVFVLARQFVDFFGLGRALAAPLGLLVAPQGPLRQPDAVVLTAAHTGRIGSACIAGPADLVVEVVSPDSTHRDGVAKWREYAEAGVQEYWIIDPRPGREREDFLVLDGNGRYRGVSPDSRGVDGSAALPGFWLETAWLRADPLPDPVWRLAEIAGLPQAALDGLRRAEERGPVV